MKCTAQIIAIWKKHYLSYLLVMVPERIAVYMVRVMWINQLFLPKTGTFEMRFSQTGILFDILLEDDT